MRIKKPSAGKNRLPNDAEGLKNMLSRANHGKLRLPTSWSSELKPWLCM